MAPRVAENWSRALRFGLGVSSWLSLGFRVQGLGFRVQGLGGSELSLTH